MKDMIPEYDREGRNNTYIRQPAELLGVRNLGVSWLGCWKEVEGSRHRDLLRMAGNLEVVGVIAGEADSGLYEGVVGGAGGDY